MKILQIGCGGIGSFYCEELYQCILQEQIPFGTEISIADSDIAEYEQMKYQNFSLKELGKNKAENLAKRFVIDNAKVFTSIAKRITSENQLKGFEIIIMCVDNEPTRKMVIKYCHGNGIEFLDLRATGRRLFAMPKAVTFEENIKFVDCQDTIEYSCQEQKDREQGLIQKGNKIVALVGIQMTLNLLRGHRNRILNVVI